MAIFGWYGIGTLLAGAVLTALLLAVGHWFPWVHKLTRIQAYVYGVVAIFLGFALWRLLNGDWVTPVGLAYIAMTGGAMVWLAYGVDKLVLKIRQAERAEVVDGELAG
jgi:hypothetical protein